MVAGSFASSGTLQMRAAGVWLAHVHGSVKLMVLGFSTRHISLCPAATLSMFMRVLHAQFLVGLSVGVGTTGNFLRLNLTSFS